MTAIDKDPERTQPKLRFRSAPWLILACLGAIVGFGLGHVGHDLQEGLASTSADANVQGKGDEVAGPCKRWADTICERMGSERAYECTHARAASRLLSGSACVQAQKSVLAKTDEFKAERVHCDELFSKVCSDLGPETKGCELAMTKAPTLSVDDCQGMKRRYGRTLAKITSIVKEQEEDGVSASAHDLPYRSEND